jgi:hypothetical protein
MSCKMCTGGLGYLTTTAAHVTHTAENLQFELTMLVSTHSDGSV